MADAKRSVTIICSYGVEQLYANYGAQSNVYKSIVLTAVQFFLLTFIAMDITCT